MEDTTFTNILLAIFIAIPIVIGVGFAIIH